MLKVNCSSIKVYSIDDSMLEKTLLCDYSAQNMKLTMHDLTDLQSCYDMQLSNVCGVVEEA